MEYKILSVKVVEVTEGKHKVDVYASLIEGEDETRSIYIQLPNEPWKEIGKVDGRGYGSTTLFFEVPDTYTYSYIRIGVGVLEPYIPKNRYKVTVLIDDKNVAEEIIDMRTVLEIPLKIVKSPSLKVPKEREKEVAKVPMPTLLATVGGLILGVGLLLYLRKHV